MPKLIHLNGPTGIGKSTIAASYAERHPGVLNLDTDRVVCLIGGWRDTFFQTFKAAQLLTAAMAETHLRTGHDVVMPQLATRVVDIEDFRAGGRWDERGCRRRRAGARGYRGGRADPRLMTRLSPCSEPGSGSLGA
ncbi:hypothetical protein ACIOD2_20325 [Amycolatopsis sp. NPDC088138]|uniref:hypothetical protein n=1 Tax=Amycolatopsis sp. NPDC088138 TaxID=3363938 RepID=UPI0038233B25